MAVDSSADIRAKSPHVLVFPFLGQGHTKPFLSIAHYLAANGISITLVQASDDLLPQISSASDMNGSHTTTASAETYPIRNETIPSGFDRSRPFSMEILRVSLDVMRDALIELLQKLMLEENAPVCLLIDSLFGWGDAVAVQFGLSRVDLWTSSASAFCLGIHVPDLVARGFIPLEF